MPTDDFLLDDGSELDDDLEFGAIDPSSPTQLYEHLRMEVDRGQVPLRIDKYLTEHTQHASRNRIQQAAEAGFLFVNDRSVKSNYKVRAGDVITLMLDRPHFDSTIVPEEMPLDVRYEDDDLMVVYKPAGLVVHPGCGNFHGTLVHAVAWHLRNLPSYDPNDPQVGLVHRIDKDTSGLLVVAKTPEAKSSLGKQFFNHDTHRSYVALVWGNFVEDEGRIEGNIGRDPKDRLRMAVFPPDSETGKPAITHYRVLERYGYTTLVECRLETGRTHQIRAHMTHIGHPLLPTSAMAAARYAVASAPLPIKLSSTTASSSARDRPCTPRPWASATPQPASRWTSHHHSPTTSKRSSRSGAITLGLPVPP